MTRINTNIPAQTSALNGTIVGLFTTAILVLAGFLTFATFATV